jgi:hypothetical protein
VFSLHAELEASPSDESHQSQESHERRGRWSRILGGRREDHSREALEREAAAEIGLTDAPATGTQEAIEATEPRSGESHTAPQSRAHKPWSRFRQALSPESGAARRERLERDAAEELGLTASRPEGITETV